MLALNDNFKPKLFKPHKRLKTKKMTFNKKMA